MPKYIINYILIFIVLVVSQAVIFNNLILFNSAIAFVFIYLILELPITININILLTISFILGLSIDIFQDTPGLNSLSCTLVAAIRKTVFHLYIPRDEDFSGKRLCIETLGKISFMKYMLTIVLLYCFLYFFIEEFYYFDLERILLRIAASTLFTILVIFAIDCLTVKTSEKRL